MHLCNFLLVLIPITLTASQGLGNAFGRQSSGDPPPPCECPDSHWFLELFGYEPECNCEADTTTTNEDIETSTTENYVTLSPEDEEFLNSFNELFNNTIVFNSMEEKVNASINLKENLKLIENINTLYNESKINFKVRPYAHSIFSEDQLREKMTGTIIPEEEEDGMILPMFDFDGNVVPEENHLDLNRKKRSTFRLPPECVNLPAYKNWAEEGKTTPVRDQGQCGSCYLFTSIEVLESTISMNYNRPPPLLSIQHPLECIKNTTAGRNACKGGLMDEAWKYSLERDGMVPEVAHYPYNQNPDGPCLDTTVKDTRAEVTHSIRFSSENEDEMMCWVALNGPVGFSMLTAGSFYQYDSGIWDDEAGSDCLNIGGGHAMMIVGYGSETSNTGEKVDYWIVQNSWSANFGDKGFMKVRRGTNICRLAKDVRYPVLKMPTQTPLKPIWTPTFCQVSGHVLKSDGTYLKSYCIDAFSRTYAHSTQRCLDRGMRLYQMDSPEAETEIFNAANAKWTNNNWANELHIAADKDSRPQKLTNMNPFGPFKVGAGDTENFRLSVCEYADYEMIQKLGTTTTRPITTTSRSQTSTTTRTNQPISTTTTRPTTTTTRTATTPTTTRTATSTTRPITTTSRATTTTRRLPVLSTKPNICRNIRDLMDSNGNYLKTVCTIYQNQNQERARSICVGNRMQLYSLALPEDEKALLEYSDSQWPSYRLWVEGGNTTRGLMVSNQGLSKFEVINMPTSTSTYFYCEYRSTSPSLTAALEPVEIPPTCSWIRNLKNSNGDYLKTMCYIPSARNPAAARTDCSNLNMSLLTLDTSEVRAAVINQSNLDFTLSGWTLWVDGRNATTGGCIGIRRFRTFDVVPFGCTNTFFFYCEYIKPVIKV